MPSAGLTDNDQPPLVCVIGGNYFAELFGADTRCASAAAVVLLLLVLVVTLGGVRASSTVQVGLVVLLLLVVVVAVVGAAPASEITNWRPFTPHGWSAIGPATSVLMLSFVGWEAVAPLTARLPQPGRQLPIVIGIAFGPTSMIYLSLAAVTISALGPRANTAVPLATLLNLAIGPGGSAVAAASAVVLAFGTTNAYLSGAGSLARSLTPRHDGRRDRADTLPRWLLGVIVLSAAVLMGLVASGTLTVAALVRIPSTFFLVVYLGCTEAAVRLLDGPVRVAAAIALVAVVAVLTFSGYALIPAAAVAGAAAWGRRRWRRQGPAVRSGASSLAGLAGRQEPR
jgi:amino acid efflux transporter